jgi:pyruvate dehydrogenase (quinone)
MSETVADHLLDRLASDWGVKRIYGYPGDGINGIVGAFGRGENRPEFIQVRHEEMAAFRPPRSARNRAGRRWRDADERPR